MAAAAHLAVAEALAAVTVEDVEAPAVDSADGVVVAVEVTEVVVVPVDVALLAEELAVAVEVLAAQGVARKFNCAIAKFKTYVLHSKVIVEPHRHGGVFVGRGKEDLLLTKNLTPGESVYGEKRISVANSAAADGDAPATSVEYRVWNPFRSKLAAGILVRTTQREASVFSEQSAALSHLMISTDFLRVVSMTST